MKRTLLASLGTLALVVSVSSPARADAFLSLSNGATTVSCNNSTAAGVTACTTAGFTTVLGGNKIEFNGGNVGGYNVLDVTLNSNSPGTATQAFALDTKTQVTNVSAGTTPLVISFAENNFTLPAGSPLGLSASQSGTFTSAAASAPGALVGENFTGYGDTSNSLTPATGVADVTPFCANPAAAPPVQACSASAVPTTFTRSGAFGLNGVESIVLNQGGVASFTGTVSATPIVPEPATLMLLGTGLVGLARARRRRTNA